MQRNIIVTSVTDEEMTERHGNHLRYDIGDCFKTDNGHFYMQRRENVLHLNKNLINVVHNSNLDDKKLIKVTKDDFTNELKRVIFELNIFECFLN